MYEEGVEPEGRKGGCEANLGEPKDKEWKIILKNKKELLHKGSSPFRVERLERVTVGMKISSHRSRCHCHSRREVR